MIAFVRTFLIGLLIVAAEAPLAEAAEPGNQWAKVEKARIGQRSDPALVYDRVGKRFFVLGGGIAWPNYTDVPHPFDDLALELSTGQWENLFPAKKDWGPSVGNCTAPGFKDEHFALVDKEGNVRPNLSTYRGVNYYNQYAYDSDSQTIFFHARGHTFSYDPAKRIWRDLMPAGGPTGSQEGPHLLWSSMCYDLVNKKVLLFGGGNVQSERGDPGTWTYDPAANKWSPLEFHSAALDEPRRQCEALRARAKGLAEAIRARYFHAELPEQKKVDLAELARQLASYVAVLQTAMKKAQTVDKHEAQQMAWASAEVEAAQRKLADVPKLLAGPVNSECIQAAEAAKVALGAAADALALQPSQRALSRLVYDPIQRKIVLFGGDQLDRLLADTWVFDCASQRWFERRPALSPSPRGGHALVYLPKSQKILLFGGYTYTSSTDYCGGQFAPLPFEMWAYDLAANEWSLLKHVEDAKEAKQVPYQHAFYMSFTTIPAAADPADRVVALGQSGGTQPRDVETWVCQVDPANRDAAGTAKHGVSPRTFTHRRGSFVPSFFDEGPQPDPAAAQARLKTLPANTWVPLVPDRRPNLDRCWGTAVYAPDHDVIMHWSGGHSSHCGTEVVCYHPGIDRWSLATASEQPLEFIYTNDGTPGHWSFQRRPWMAPHTYRSYGYDPVLKRMLFAGQGDRTYFFDPSSGDWERRTISNPFDGEIFTVQICATPQGAVAWAKLLADRTQTGLWRMDAASQTWKALPLTGKLPTHNPDRHGMAYDSKRDRLLCFSGSGGESGGDVVAYDFKLGTAKSLAPAGQKIAALPSRETVYLPEADLVLVEAQVEGKRWLAYDCAKNAWLGVKFTGPDLIGDQAFNNSLGLTYDPGRKLVWVLGQHSEVWALRFDRETADAEALK